MTKHASKHGKVMSGMVVTVGTVQVYWLDVTEVMNVMALMKVMDEWKERRERL